MGREFPRRRGARSFSRTFFELRGDECVPDCELILIGCRYYNTSNPVLDCFQDSHSLRTYIYIFHFSLSKKDALAHSKAKYYCLLGHKELREPLELTL